MTRVREKGNWAPAATGRTARMAGPFGGVEARREIESQSSYQAGRFGITTQDVHGLHRLAAGALDQIIFGAHDQ